MAHSRLYAQPFIPLKLICNVCNTLAPHIFDRLFICKTCSAIDYLEDKNSSLIVGYTLLYRVQEEAAVKAENDRKTDENRRKEASVKRAKEFVDSKKELQKKKPLDSEPYYPSYYAYNDADGFDDDYNY